MWAASKCWAITSTQSLQSSSPLQVIPFARVRCQHYDRFKILRGGTVRPVYTASSAMHANVETASEGLTWREAHLCRLVSLERYIEAREMSVHSRIEGKQDYVRHADGPVVDR